MRKTIKELGSVLIGVGLMLSLAGVAPALAQHEGHKMPGMTRTKPVSRKKAKTVRKKRVSRKKRRTVPRKPPMKPPMKPAMTDMPGMNMPGHQMAPSPRSQASPAPEHMNMPGRTMPGQEMRASPAPPASPATHEHMPGMQMPSASPEPATAPSGASHSPMDMPIPSGSPGAQPAEAGAHDSMDHWGGGMPEMSKMLMGPLLVMSGDDMGIRVGSSDTNIMPMGQMGSGTSWAPASTPMHMWHKVSGDWLLMLHGEVKIGINSQGGPRGLTKFESANWLMPMAFHKVGKGTLQLRGMVSFEPFTFPPGGSPLLFQTGETYKDQRLIDRQHPHDLFMELSAQYTRALGERATWFTYFGYPGEPALGPPAFMHRASASENSSAPRAHHLQDSTHISFGVLTSGFTYRWFKLEGSVFNGHEPDEDRYDFDSGKWNSRAARLSVAPNQNWSMQASYGFLRRPEASEPETDIRRTTASLHYNKPFQRGNWASSFIWGRNHATGAGEMHNVNGYTFESTVNFKGKNYVYTRLELVDRNELLRAVDRVLLGITDDHPSFRIGAYTFGGARDLYNTEKVSIGLGSDLTLYSKPAVLDPIYGGNPVSWKVFLRLRPAKMNSSSGHSGH